MKCIFLLYNNVTCILLLSMYWPHPCPRLPVRRLGRFLSNPWMEYILTLFMVYSPPVKMTVFSSSIAQAYVVWYFIWNKILDPCSVTSSAVFLLSESWPPIKTSPDGDIHDECLTLGCDRFLVTSQTPAEVRLRQEFGLNWPPQISKPVWVWYLLLPGRSGREQLEEPSSPIASTDLLFG